MNSDFERKQTFRCMGVARSSFQVVFRVENFMCIQNLIWPWKRTFFYFKIHGELPAEFGWGNSSLATTSTLRTRRPWRGWWSARLLVGTTHIYTVVSHRTWISFKDSVEKDIPSFGKTSFLVSSQPHKSACGLENFPQIKKPSFL